MSIPTMDGTPPVSLDPQDSVAPVNGVAAGEPPFVASAGSAPIGEVAIPTSIALPTNVRYTVLAWACSLSMLTYIDRVCIKTVGSDMQADLGLSKTDFGWVFGSFGLAYALFEVPSGWLGDRFGPRSVLVRIVLWWSVFTALTGCVVYFHYDLGALPIPGYGAIPLAFSSLVLLVIIRFLFGMGEAGAYPNTARALRNWFPYSRRGLAQGLLWTFGRWGGAIAPPLIVLFAWPYGWKGAFILFGLVGALWALFFGYFFRNSPDDHPDVNDAEKAFIREKGDEHAKLPLSWGAMLSSRTLWFLCAMYLCSNAGWCFFITWDVEYYKNVLHLGGTPLMIASGAPLFFGGIACLTGGMLTDRQVRIWGRRWGRTAQGCIAYALGGIFFLSALALRDFPALSVTCLCVASFGKDFAMAVAWSTCIDIGHRYSGTVSGFMNGVGNLGTFFGPIIVGYLAGQRGEWGLALIFSASLFFIASVCWLFINPRHVVVYGNAERESLRAQGVLD